MKIVIVAVGKARNGPELELYHYYKTRLSWPVTLIEVEDKKSTTPEKRKSKEAALLLAEVPNGAYIVVLDERGKSFGSAAFAKKIAACQNEGYGTMAVLIGGADGHDESVRKKAHLVLSLGEMTWPHMLVRGLLVEQLYRAWSILHNHPYHRA